MPVAVPQHLRTRPTRPATMRHGLALRRGTVLTVGAAVAVPGALGALGTAPAIGAPAATTAPAAAPTTAPMSPTAPSEVVVLRYGSTGTYVRTLQSRLHLTVDGSFGPATLAKVKAFQRTKQLGVDGVVGPKTWAALGGFPGPQPSDPKPQDPPSSGSCAVKVIRYGASGATVKQLQQRLGIGADGSFGPGTLAAVKKFQKAKGLAADGVVGPRTWTALGGFPCDTKPADPPSDVSGQQVLSIAKKYLGIDYVYGGSSPSEGFDCSGLTQYVYRQVGIDLPRTSKAQSQFRAGVSLQNLRVGDLVFFHSPIRHVAIYAGNGQILDASQPGTKISIHKMWVPPVKAIRLV